MPVDRRAFLALGALSLVSCATTNGADGGYPDASAGGPSAGTGPDGTRRSLPPPATGGPAAGGGTDTTRITPRSLPQDPAGSASPGTPSPGTPSPVGPARFVVRGAAASTAVALTFHTNGDLALARRLTEIMGDHGGRMTNFVVGDWIDANPAWARTLLDGGHELANHTYTHPGFAALSRSAMASEIGRCRDALARLTGDGGRYFRPSGTDDGLAQPSAAVLDEAGRAGYGIVLGWDVEPFDYKDPGADAVRTRVLDAVRGGSVVSLHFGHRGTVDALDGILGGLADRGLRPVTVSELLRDG